MGLPGKPDGNSGADVEKFYLDGAHSRIADYCESDVVNTYRVWLAMNSSAGAGSRPLSASTGYRRHGTQFSQSKPLLRRDTAGRAVLGT